MNEHAKTYITRSGSSQSLSGFRDQPSSVAVFGSVWQRVAVCGSALQSFSEFLDQPSSVLQ